MASLMLASPSARAGTYTDAQTGGTAASTVTPASTRTSPASPTYAIAYSSVSPMSPDGIPTYTIQISPGTFTDTFTWVPASGQTATTDPPPSCVIVEQTSSAAWYVRSESGTGTGSGQANCGLSGGTVTTSTYGGNGPSASLSAVLYSVKTSPGASFSESCSPTASFTGTTGSSGFVEGEATVGGGASVYPITINPGLAIKDSSGNYDILVGQICTASLNGIPSNCTVSNYHWSVSGSTFQSWAVSDDQSHTTEVDGLGTTTNPTASWFWDDNLGSGKSKQETITCTATVTLPAGQGSPLSITVTQPVTVYMPNWTCTGTGGTMQVNTSAPSGNGTDYWLYAGPASGSSTGVGMDWKATEAAPSAPVAFGDGVLELVQTETPNSTYTSSTGIVYNRSNNGQQGLDSSYPYPWASPAPSYESNDNPGLDLTAFSAVSAHLQYSFVDTLMYEPPDRGQYVPIATLSWSTNGNAQIPGTNNWADYGSGSAGAITPSGLQNFTGSNTFPSWTKNVGNGTYTWVAAH